MGSSHHNSRKDLYSYMINMVNAYNLEGNLALNEESIDDFVSWRNNDNVLRKIQFFESNEDTYKAFGPYWLEIAKSYYENNDYEKCLEAITEYENLGVQIFRKDFEYAEVLPLAITAASEALEKEEYVERTADYCKKILNNTNDEQWSLRYFAGEAYCGLYEDTGKEEYLREAYQIALNNVNYLVDKQRELTDIYCADIVKREIPKGATKKLKKEINKYNEMLEENRKTELPPIYEPLLINCELLFTVVDELNIPIEEKEKIDALVRGEYETIFPVIPIDEMYRISEADESESEIEFIDKKLYIPVQYLTDNSDIKLAVTAATQSGTFEDWELSEIIRGTKGDLSSYVAVFKSDSVKKIKFNEGDTIRVKIIVREDCNIPSIQVAFEASRKKRANWMGKWEWLDNASSFTDSVLFERFEE